tara:strand:- start:617 stop:3298 length:2682 start_codon:yes stop_codon:yes gene_type:complete
MTEPTIDQALQQGIAAHKNGQLGEANRLYSAILKSHPKHPDANHNMGVLAVSVGKVEQSLQFFKTALKTNAGIAQFWLSYIDALIKLDRLVEAKDVLSVAKRNGAKGSGFDRLEHKLSELNQQHLGSNPIVPQVQNPTHSQLQEVMALYNQGQLQQALEQSQALLEQYPESATLWNIVGATSAQTGKLDQSILAFQKLISLKPRSSDAHNNLGNVFQEQGKLEEAIVSYKTALSLKPNFAAAYNNMGNALNKQGDLEEAIVAFTQAIAIDPSYVDALSNMGNALQDQDKLDGAIEAYKKALSFAPNYAEAYNNMGNALKKQCKLDEAIRSYKEALAIAPNFAIAHHNIGNALNEQNNREGAFEAYCKALSINPNLAETYNNIGIVLKGLSFRKANPNFQKIITSLLDKKRYVRPKDVAPACISLLKFEPKLIQLLRAMPLSDNRAELLSAISDLCEVHLLLKLMSECPLPDLQLENLFTELRATLLLSILDIPITQEVLKFQSALALQCHTNEYLYYCSEDESESVSHLEAIVEHELVRGQQPKPQYLLCLASYKPLGHYDWSDRLAFSTEIRDVFKRQITEPRHELDLRSKFNIQNGPRDNVSKKVREQYEESPYPRWVNLRLPIAQVAVSDIANQLKLKLFSHEVSAVEKPKILIAGCGTGQQSISTAATFKGSTVLAIDLSLTSLSYALRKTEEYGLRNIEYKYADILDLDKKENQFDIIESVGVLHHMSDPLAGWQKLVECLKPGGLIKIGLYSELARSNIARIRAKISSQYIGSNTDDIRSFRTSILNSAEASYKEIFASSDFYSLSSLKDLLFHVQEHRFTIPEIKAALIDLGLVFCGFEGDQIISQFQHTYPGSKDLYDLDKWLIYERANPKTFGRMYQFWCQKIH